MMPPMVPLSSELAGLVARLSWLYCQWRGWVPGQAVLPEALLGAPDGVTTEGVVVSVMLPLRAATWAAAPPVAPKGGGRR